MKRTNGRIGVGLVLVSTFVGACLTEREKSDASAEAVARPEAALPEARDAKDVVLAVRAQLDRAFGTANIPLSGVRNSMVSLNHFDVLGVKAISDTEVLSPNGLLAEPAPARADVALPMRADGAFHLRDERSGLSIDVGLIGATTSAREQSDGYVVYRSGYAKGAHIVHRPTEQGTEDYVYFPEELPENPELRYDLALGEDVAGLRLISGTIEMLDAGGAPRLRMAAPYAVDGDGRQLAVNVAIEGCSYDTSGSMPWGRPTVQPGSRHCTVHLTWDATAKAPLVVDPAWRLTSNMRAFRLNMTATHLGGGKVIVTGGDAGPNTSSLNSTEYYSLAVDVWADGPPMGKQRADHTAVMLDDALYVIGGRYLSNGTKAITNYVEKLSPTLADPMWEGATNGLGMGRYKHTATLIPGKGILVAGGFDTGDKATSTAEFCAFPNMSWAPYPMAHPRVGHTAILTGQTTVLVTGGDGSPQSPNCSEVFDQAHEAGNPPWKTVVGNLPHSRAYHVATVIGDDSILFAGGRSPAGEPLADVDIYHPKGNSWELKVPPMSTARVFFAAARAPFGEGVVVMGGKAGNAVGAPALSSAEFYKVGDAEWTSLDPMKVARANFGVVSLLGGYILAVGGAAGATSAAGTTDLLGCSKDAECTANDGKAYCSKDHICKPLKEVGEACDVRSAMNGGEHCFEDNCKLCGVNGEFGNCVDGICCSDACDGQCETCDAAGQCIPVTGSPITNKLNDALPKRGLCTEHDVCGGACNGIKVEKCTYPQGNSCEKSCTNGTVESKSCDGNGSCSIVESKELCIPYACDTVTNQCTATCTPKTEDAPQTGCDDNAECDKEAKLCFPRSTSCFDENTMTLPNGEPQSCGDYRCDEKDKKCFTSCTTAYDCKVVDPEKTTPYVCDDNNQCVLKPVLEDTGTTVTGCSTAPANDSSHFGWLAALAIAGTVAARRNRARA